MVTYPVTAVRAKEVTAKLETLLAADRPTLAEVKVLTPETLPNPITEPVLAFALRCWSEADARGDRAALLRLPRTSRTGSPRARHLAVELLVAPFAPTPAEFHALGQVHRCQRSGNGLPQ